MNISSLFARSTRNLSLALAVAALVGLSGTALAQSKGAERLVQLQNVKTVQDLQKIEAGDTLVMSCPKCKDSTATIVEKSFKAVKPEEVKTAAIHLCPSCDTKVVTTGTGKAAKDTLVHTCKTCGSQEAVCCVIKKNAGATKGMEHAEQK